MRGYLNLDQKYKIESFKGNRLKQVHYHYWQKDDLTSLDWISLKFANGIITFTSGDLAEDISVVEFIDDVKNLQGDYNIISNDVTKDEGWSNFYNRKLTSFKITDYKGYCNTSVILDFENQIVEIIAGVDSVKSKFLDRGF